MISGSLIAIFLSTALIGVLALHDPKRLRTAARIDAPAGKRPLSQSLRRALGAMVFVPGVVLAAVGQWGAFLIWMGALCTLGWFAAVLFAPHPLRRD